VKLITKLGIATAGIALTVGLAETKPAQALTWNWSFNGGAEAGTFDTNGTLADTAGAFNFIVDINTFTLTSSTFAPSLVGATFNEGAQPGTGFLWNGTTATQFYRSGGDLINGSNYFSAPYAVLFGIIGSPVARITDNSTSQNTGFQALTLTPVAATPVPFGFSTNLSLGILGAYTLGNRLLKKAKAAKKPVEL
jgi:hypothetical protein